jgi:hypothetical protein
MFTTHWTQNIEIINVGLIAASAVVAILWPFETLLLAYAVLGPLHYLTEISWLHDRRYFLPRKGDLAPIVIAGIMLIVIASTVESSRKSDFQRAVECAALFSIFAFAFVMVTIRNWPRRLAGLVLLIPACWIIARHAPFSVSLSAYLPTIIHVYVFTGMFMLLGCLRKPSRSNAGALLVFIAFPFVCWLIPLGASTAASDWARESYVATLGSVNRVVLRDIELDLERGAILDHPISILITRVLGFAYLYHYLNWFSKVEIIGWARISPARSLVILALWIGAVALYFYNYVVGFAILLMLSFMHVLLEFPLNHLSIQQIGGHLRSRTLKDSPASGVH